LIGVAFFTLFERKLLGYLHVRLGPNKVGFYGILQPFRDAIKLFRKEINKLIKLNFYYYFISPLFGMFLFMILWCVFPIWFSIVFFLYSLIFFFTLSRLMVYFLLGSGWSSSSKYRSIGSYRSAAQAVSYEVRIMFTLLGICWLIGRYIMFVWEFYQRRVWFFFINLPLFFCWLLTCLAERNRSPFDFREGESELVSGFNTEYGGGLFSVIFITEYGSILFLGGLTSFLFLGGGLFVGIKIVLISFFYIWVRGRFPRLRYDKLIIISWKGMLPLILGILLYLFLIGNLF